MVRAMRASVLLAMGLLYIVWGSTYLAIRSASRRCTRSRRRGCASCSRGCSRSLPSPRSDASADGRAPPRCAAPRSAGSGCIIGGVGLVTITESHAPSNLTAVLASTTSLWVVGYRALAGERIGRGSIAGALLGVVGVLVLLSPGGSGADSPWLLLALVASLFWSTGSFYGRRLTQPADPFVGAVIQMLIAGAVMLVAGVALDGVGALDLTAASARSLLALAYLVVAGRHRVLRLRLGAASTSRSRRSSATSTSTRPSRCCSARSSWTRACARRRWSAPHS